MAGNYPRLNRGAIRDKVRTITAIESTNLVTDTHINNIINEELHKLITLTDEVEQYWPGSGVGGRITTTEGGITYRIPGWRFDNTTQFPSGLPGNYYLNTDTDVAPWNTTGSGVSKAGYYDNFLVYSVAARLLREQDDDSKRAEEYDKQAGDIAKLLVQQEFVSHNADQLASIGSSDASFTMRLYFKALYLLRSPLSIDADYSIPLLEVISGVLDSRNELIGKYNWTGLTGSFADWNPYGDMFAYAAAAKLGPRFGLNKEEVDSLSADYLRREDAIVREKLVTPGQSKASSSTAELVATVRSLVSDFSKNVSDTVIEGFIEDEFNTLVSERDWKWLQVDVTAYYWPTTPFITLTQNGNSTIFTGNAGQPAIRRILEVNHVEPFSYTLGDPGSEVQTSVKPLYEATTYGDYVNSGDYRYVLQFADEVQRTDQVSPPIHNITSLTGATALTILPKPTSPMKLDIRFLLEPTSLDAYMSTGISFADPTYFGPFAFPIPYYRPHSKLHPRFMKYLAYRVAAKVLAFLDSKNNKLMGYYEEEASRIYDAMLKHYVLTNNTASFTIGQNPETPYKYSPYFRGV